MSENDISKHGQPDGQNLPFHSLIRDAPKKAKKCIPWTQMADSIIHSDVDK